MGDFADKKGFLIKRIIILGATGSIGKQAIDVCKSLGYEVTGLSAQKSAGLLIEQARELKAKTVCIGDSGLAEQVKAALDGVEVLSGEGGLCELAGRECDILINAVVGIAGLAPTLAAIEKGRTIALANKETLVTGGDLVIKSAKRKSAAILPVDSEHSAIFQSMQGNKPEQVKKIILTASGGPFFGKTAAELEHATIEQALNHPNWSMGSKITVDSATLMNKGLELIEACMLFCKTPDEIEIVVHRESIIHSLVEYDDNAVIAQLGTADMRIPIQYALTYPDRLPCSGQRLSLTDCAALTFAKPDIDTFVCLKACIEAALRGGLYPAIVNGANEQAVELFLKGKIGFMDIGRLVYGSLSLKYSMRDFELNDILLADRLARNYVLSMV